MIYFTPTGKVIKILLPKHPLKEQMQLILKVKFSLTRGAVTKGFFVIDVLYIKAAFHLFTGS